MTGAANGQGRFRLLLVGAGGQGVLTASRLIGEAAAEAGLRPVLGQIHGMSQRGGSVQSTVLIGPGDSSFIGRGQADVVLGMEPLETLRARPEMSRATSVLVNLGCVPSSLSTHAGVEYPDVEGILGELRSVAGRVVTVDGEAIAAEVGVSRTLNIALLGALAGLGLLPIETAALWRAIEKSVPARYLEPNARAFELGRKAVAA